jgi:hypothetical protein
MAEPGKCSGCGKKVDDKGSPRCGPCGERHKNRERDRRNERMKAEPDLCPRCWERKKEGKLQACFQCAFGTEREKVEDWVDLMFPLDKQKKKKWRSARKLL